METLSELENAELPESVTVPDRHTEELVRRLDDTATNHTEDSPWTEVRENLLGE